MGLKQTVAPAVEPISLTEGKLHLRIDTTAEDGLISSLIKTARQYCENYQQRACNGHLCHSATGYMAGHHGLRNVSRIINASSKLRRCIV